MSAKEETHHVIPLNTRYQLYHHGTPVSDIFESADKCIWVLVKLQSYSSDYAFRYLGYEIREGTMLK